MKDWKDMLGAAFGIDPAAAQSQAEQATEPAARSAAEQQGNTVVHVVLEKKGRNGKQATIVTDLACDDDALKELARELKQVCGTGGSARGGEILIQGDKRAEVTSLLKQKGFKVR